MDSLGEELACGGGNAFGIESAIFQLVDAARMFAERIGKACAADGNSRETP